MTAHVITRTPQTEDKDAESRREEQFPPVRRSQLISRRDVQAGGTGTDPPERQIPGLTASVPLPSEARASDRRHHKSLPEN